MNKPENILNVQDEMGETPVWEPSEKALYWIDIAGERLHRYDSSTKKYEIYKAGMPDGLTVDSQGFIWSAHWEGSRVTRYDPEGKIDMEIKVPARIATCVGFGGDDMDELFITTAWYGLDQENRAKQPQAGDLFRVKTNIKGLVEPGFLG